MTTTEWCGAESLYLAINAPISRLTKPTLPTLLTEDPNARLLQILLPCIFFPFVLMSIFKGRLFPRTSLVLLGAGVGFAVSQGILFGRPLLFPTGFSCARQWLSGAGGVVVGALVAYVVGRFTPRLDALVLGGLLSFSIFHQFPQLDQIATGFPGIDDIKTLFLGWGFVAWVSTAVASFLFFFLFCWPKLKPLKTALYVTVPGAWTISQNVRSITKDKSSLADTIPLAWVVVIFVGAFVVIFVIQLILISRTLARIREQQNMPIPFSRNVPNSVQRVYR